MLSCLETIPNGNIIYPPLLMALLFTEPCGFVSPLENNLLGLGFGISTFQRDSKSDTQCFDTSV